MMAITQDNLKDFAFEDDGDFEEDILAGSPKNEAEQFIKYYEQKYGFKKIAG
jgi:hypothetical protein